MFRGFYYQIQTTVQRWFHLSPTDVLQCESAEDIEVIRQAVIDGELHIDRVVEQVKVRQKLTLRSAAVVSAIARYFEAMRDGAAPSLFRFITTAGPTRERGVVFPRNLPGLSAWNLAKNGELEAVERTALIKDARDILRSVARPRDISTALWSDLQAHIEALTVEEFGSAFVERIEWATGSSDVGSLRQQLCTETLRMKWAADESGANTIVDLLIAHVFHLLSRPGPKTLTLADLKTVVVARPPSAADQSIIRLLDSFAADTSERLLGLEDTSSAILTRVREVGSTLTTILQRRDDTGLQPVDLSIGTVDEPPVAPVLLTKRTAVAAEIVDLLRASTLAVIVGPTGMGKTVLALLTFQNWQDKPRDWISFRGLVRPETRAHFQVQLAMRIGLRGSEESMGFSDLASEYASRLQGGLLVVDDLPNLNSDRRLADYFGVLATTMDAVGARILVTSHAQLPDSVRTVLRSPAIEWRVPAMTSKEISDLMEVAHLPAPFRQAGLVDTVQAITSGHPILVVATIRYMMSEPRFDKVRLVTLLTGDPVKSVRLRTRQHLRDLLSNDQARELLDRLSLTNGTFHRSVVFAVADVEPQVPRCGEILQELTGVWISDLPVDRYELSPLLVGIGTETLAPKLLGAVHNAIANAYFGGGTIGPHEAMQILLHLLAAKNWSAVSGFLLQLALHIQTEKQAQFFDSILVVLRPLPQEIPTSAQIVILAVQIRIAYLTNGDVSAFERDFRALVTTPTGEALLSACYGWLLVGPLSPKTSARLASEGAIRAARLYPQLRAQLPQIAETSQELHPSTLLWTCVAFMSTDDDVSAAVEVFCDATDDELRSAFGNADVAHGVEIFTTTCWSLELNKSDDSRDWTRPLLLLERLINKATSAKILPLLFAAQRAKATVLADYCSRLADSLALIRVNRNIHNDGEVLRRQHLAGCFLLDHASPEKALVEFGSALATDPNCDPVTFADAARRASEAAARLQEWQEAVRYGIRAVRALKEAVLLFDRLDMLTELSWLHWQHGSRSRAAAALGAVVDALVATIDVDSDRFRESFRKASHVGGWMSESAAVGESPQMAWGGTQYVSPYAGMASRSRPALATLESPMLPPLLLFMQGRFEAAVDLRLRALGHYRRARQSAAAYECDGIECLAASAQAETAATLGRVDESVEASLFGVRFFILAGKCEVGTDFENQGISTSWDSSGSEVRAPIERLAYWTSIAAVLVGALARRSSHSDILKLIHGLEVAFSNCSHSTAEPAHWKQLLQLAETHFRVSVPVDTIMQKIGETPRDYGPLLVLCLALMNHPDALPRDICSAQAVSLSVCKEYERMARTPVADLATVIQLSWQKITQDRAFTLSAPRLIRDTLSKCVEPTIPNAARILLSAQASTGVKLDRALHQFLATTAADT